MLAALQRAVYRFDLRWMIRWPCLWSFSDAGAQFCLVVVPAGIAWAWVVTSRTLDLSETFSVTEANLAGAMAGGMTAGAIVMVGTLLQEMTAWPSRYPAPSEEIRWSAFERRVARAVEAAPLVLLALLPGFTAQSVHRRQAAMVGEEELVHDLNRLNRGLGACCALEPYSEACLWRRPVPMSSAEIVELMAWPTGFQDPRPLPAVPAAEAHAAVVQLAASLKRYVRPSPSPPPGPLSFRPYDLDVPAHPDRRTPVERVCAEVRREDLSTVDLNVSRILAGKREARHPHRRWSWLVDGVLLAVLLIALHSAGLTADAAGGISALLAVFALEALLPYRWEARLDEGIWLVWTFLALAAVVSWPRHRFPFWSFGTFVAGLIAFAAGKRAWSGTGLFGTQADRAIVVFAIVVAIVLAPRLRRASRHAGASPGHDLVPVRPNAS